MGRHNNKGKYTTHKYGIKSSNYEKMRVQMQEMGNACEIKRAAT